MSPPDDHQLPSDLNDDVAGITINESIDSEYSGTFYDLIEDDFDDEDDDDDVDDLSEDDGGLEEDVFPKVEKGLTTMAFLFEQGVILAVDHSCESVENVINLTSHILVAACGEIEDCGSFLRDLQTQYNNHELEEGKIISVEEASERLADIISLSAKERGSSSLYLIIAGWDQVNGPSLFRVDGAGDLFEAKYTANGSGSSWVEYCSRRYDGLRSDQEAIEFARDTIRLAASDVKRNITRGQFGGLISGYHVGAHGCSRVFHKEEIGEVGGVTVLYPD